MMVIFLVNWEVNGLVKSKEGSGFGGWKRVDLLGIF